jgi:hypothetical protein
MLTAAATYATGWSMTKAGLPAAAVTSATARWQQKQECNISKNRRGVSKRKDNNSSRNTQQQQGGQQSRDASSSRILAPVRSTTKQGNH